MESTPIFAALAEPGPGLAPSEHGARRSAHAEGRSVTDLLRALRNDHVASTATAPTARGGAGDEGRRRPTRGARVGHVPDLLSFPAPRR